MNWLDKNELLKEKVIVISGGTKGVGRDLGIVCAKAGAKVVLGGRDRAAADVIIETIHQSGGEVYFEAVDLMDLQSVKALFDRTIQRFQKIDGFVNYAGITTASALIDTDADTFDDVMDINFRAAFFCTKYAIRYMATQKSGSIVLVNSCHAGHGEKDRAVYSCSKGALLNLAEHIAFHYADQGIRCNTITMGWTLTEGELALRTQQGMTAGHLQKIASQAIPMGRMQTSSDYIPGFLYLLSDLSTMVTGSNIRISGGFYI